MKRWMILLAAVAALSIPPAATAAQSRVSLRAEVKQLRADNRCLESKFHWYAGAYFAYYFAADTATGAISDFLFRSKPQSVLNDGLAKLGRELNEDLNRLGMAPSCHT